MVDLVRDFLVVHRSMSKLVDAYRQGELEFAEVERLVRSDESSALYRMKERSHAIFRIDAATSILEVQTAALFDLAVGSLFHESMKLRENLYQQEFYLPRIHALRAGMDDSSGELFEEFEKILESAARRLGESVAEAEVLLGQTRKQLFRLMAEHRDEGLLARCLYAEEERISEVVEGGLDSLFVQIHGDAVTGYMQAAESYLESSYFTDALAVLRDASTRAPERTDIRGLCRYAEGMQAFFSRDYERSLERLGEWLEAGEEVDRQERIKLAHAAMSHIENLVEDDGAAELVEAGKRLVDQLAQRLEG